MEETGDSREERRRRRRLIGHGGRPRKILNGFRWRKRYAKVLLKGREEEGSHSLSLGAKCEEGRRRESEGRTTSSFRFSSLFCGL